MYNNVTTAYQLVTTLSFPERKLKQKFNTHAHTCISRCTVTCNSILSTLYTRGLVIAVISIDTWNMLATIISKETIITFALKPTAVHINTATHFITPLCHLTWVVGQATVSVETDRAVTGGGVIGAYDTLAVIVTLLVRCVITGDFFLTQWSLVEACTVTPEGFRVAGGGTQLNTGTIVVTRVTVAIVNVLAV